MKTALKKPKRQRGIRGFGTIVHRAEKVSKPWEVRIRYYDSATGKRVTKAAFYATEAEARIAQPMLAQRYATGAIDRSDDMPFAAYIAMWLDDKKKAWEHSTYRTQENYVRVHLLGEHSRLGPMPLRSIGERDVKQFMERLQTAGASDYTRSSVLVTLKMALREAVKNGYVMTNAADNVTPPTIEKKEQVALTIDQLRHFLEVADHHELGSLFRFLADTGCRLSEALALTWDDVNGDKVTISKALGKDDEGNVYRKSTKTGDVRKNIVLQPATVFAMKRINRKRKTWENIVWANDKGNPIDQSHFRSRVAQPLFKAAKLPKGFTIHGFRRTAPTLQFQQGADLPTVKARGGWKSDRIVLGVYAQSTDEGQRKLAESMADELRDTRDDGMKVSTPSLVIGKRKPKKVG